MKKLIYLLTCLIIIGCTTDEVEGIDVQQDVTAAEQNETNGHVSTLYFNGIKLMADDFGTHYLFQGDILILKGKSLNKAAAIDPSLWWPSNSIPYSIDPNLSGQYRVEDAMSHFEANTNLDFVERTTETNYIYFTTGIGCSSYVGQVGGRQAITLSASCSTGNTIHEIGHAIGLWHEHMRADRDQYVDVLMENVIDGYEHNFLKYTETNWGGVDLTDALDFNSVMLYSSYSFSANGQPTIVKEDGSTYTVNRQYLSDGDIYGINLMYPADETTEPEPDIDGDGLTDRNDRCPEEAGAIENDGCPDSDGDRIVDIDDDCPNEAGVPELNGCPEEEEPEPEYVNGKIYTIAGEEVLYLNGRWYSQQGKSGRWVLVELVNGKWIKPKGKPVTKNRK